MKNSLKYVLISAMAIWLLTSCSNDAEPDNDVMTKSSTIFAAFSPMVKADNLGDDDTEDTAPIITDGFSDGSLLYFSQMPQGSSPNFEDEDETAANYLYIYEYRPNAKATWESGENFVTHNDRLSFNWERTVGVGPSGNAFKFFGFYFPEDNIIRWKVEKDQTGGQTDPYDKKNFIKSDIMGAYHATSAIYTRMRFRLFHLMTYLKVTLYVPVYKAQYSDPEKQNYSGFEAGALMGGFLLDALTDFNIEWAASKSSDTEAPFVQTPANGPKSHIKMYRHRSDDTQTEPLDVRNYYNGNVDGITEGMDEVRAYDFSVIFPTQTFTGNFLCFALTTPGGDVKYYYFASSQVNGAGIDLTQGTLQQLYLYLPRKTNETVLIGAKILPWQDAQTDMTVTKKENNE